MRYTEKSTWAIPHCRCLGKSSRSLETSEWVQQVKRVNFWKYIGRSKPEDGCNRETGSALRPVAQFVCQWSLWEHLSDSAQSQVALELCSCSVNHTNCCSRQGLAWASPPSPLESLYDNAWPLRHSRRKHCACFHQSPLWQRQMVQSSTFTSIPAGMIVVPAKQFGPAAWEGEEKDRKEGMRTTRNGCGSPESFSSSEGLGWTDAKRGWELGGGGGSQSRRTDLFTGMHRWACFCNTKALLLVSPSPLTWSALHPNAPWAEKPARSWHGSTERLEYRETEEGEEADLRGSREDGVNHFSRYEKATEQPQQFLAWLSDT